MCLREIPGAPLQTQPNFGVSDLFDYIALRALCVVISYKLGSLITSQNISLKNNKILFAILLRIAV